MSATSTPKISQRTRSFNQSINEREREEEEEGVTLGRRCVSTAGVVQSKKHCRLDDGDDERPYSSTHLPPAPMAASSSSPLTLTATAAAPNANATKKHTKKPKSARERERQRTHRPFAAAAAKLGEEEEEGEGEETLCGLMRGGRGGGERNWASVCFGFCVSLSR